MLVFVFLECNIKILNRIESIYKKNNLTYTYKKFLNANRIKSLIPFLKNDKKNNNSKINLILLNRIGNASIKNSYDQKKIRNFLYENLNNI